MYSRSSIIYLSYCALNIWVVNVQSGHWVLTMKTFIMWIRKCQCNHVTRYMYVHVSIPSIVGDESMHNMYMQGSDSAMMWCDTCTYTHTHSLLVTKTFIIRIRECQCNHVTLVHVYQCEARMRSKSMHWSGGNAI